MEPPADGAEEHQLVLVDLGGVQSGDLAPRTGRVVPVLQVLGREDQRGEEHASATLHGPAGRLPAILVRGRIGAGNVRLDLDQVVQRDLQGAVAGARAAEGLLDEGAERQHALAAGGRITAVRRGRQGPDGLNDLRRGVSLTFSNGVGRRSRSESLTDKVVHKIHFPLGLPEQGGRGTRARHAVGLNGAAIGAPGMPSQLRGDGGVHVLGSEAAAGRAGRNQASGRVRVTVILPDHIHRVRGSRRDRALGGEAIQRKHRRGRGGCGGGERRCIGVRMGRLIRYLV